MIRTQIQLTEEQAEKLESMAEAQQCSKAELVRMALDRFFAEEGTMSKQERMRRSLAVIGKYRSGHTDISVNHDEHLAEIYGEW